ncbi:XRE family transcriptional regulator [Bacillus sp. HNG]|uniref:helix-turn-helix domain-containing protein n=1 Tax=Bacillus sp. HNG TaxID=2293325 RepID=UPI000E2F5C6F|nr:helix-turn-helix transcriptional regulator [Bacillus sp. HNG]RFB17420.1 XRE family transcriptional regulator [Bacillus sp. HNG]
MVERDIDKKKLTKHFGKVLRETRKEMDLTLEEVARDSFIDDKYIGKIETGNRGPGLLTLYKLRKRANISVDEIFDKIPEDQVLDDPDE